MKNRSPSGRRLRLESLERRQMLSANVAAVLSGGNLTLTGNKFDVSVEVHETASNTFKITGLNGTTITYGSSTGSSETVAAVTGSLTANLPGSGSGAQSFKLDTASGSPETFVGGNVSVTMGNESNSVSILGELEIEGNTKVTTGSGNAVVTAGNDVSLDGSLGITTGHGNAAISIYAATIGGNLTIQTGSGNQEIAVGKFVDVDEYNVEIDGSASIQTGPGNSTVTILDTHFSSGEEDEVAQVVRPNFTIPSTLNDGDLSIVLGAGNNIITIGTSLDPFPSDVAIDGNCYIQTSTGNTEVVAQSTSFGGDLDIAHGAGNTAVILGAFDPFTDEDADVNVFGNLSITTSTGSALIVVGGTAEGDTAFIEGNTTIVTGSGTASISLTNDFLLGSLSINTGSGTASIAISDNTVGGPVSVDTGSGNATVTIVGGGFESTLSIVLSSGSGSVKITHATVNGATTLNGGGGATLYFDGTDTFNGGISYSHFKKVTT